MQAMCPLLPALWQGQLASCSLCKGKFPMELSSVFYAESVLTKHWLISVLTASVLGGLWWWWWWGPGKKEVYRKGVSSST